MISEERVAEIIKNNGTVWCINIYHRPYRAVPIIFDGKREIDAHAFVSGWNAKNIFETKEEVEEYLKYGNITKTEKFPYVSYNDFLRGKIIEVENVVSVSKATKSDCIVIWDMVKGKQQIIDYATRENYHKALDLCVKLWKGVE